MSHCPEIVATGITPEKYASLVATAQSQGLNLTGETGNTSYQGMDFSWNYDSAGQCLTIQCTNKPILGPCAMIESRIRSHVG